MRLHKHIHSWLTNLNRLGVFFTISPPHYYEFTLSFCLTFGHNSGVLRLCNTRKNSPVGMGLASIRFPITGAVTTRRLSDKNDREPSCVHPVPHHGVPWAGWTQGPSLLVSYAKTNGRRDIDGY